ncbi:tRNA pseudouridine(38-40) synthase TruA [Clostridium sp. OM02-18AC]|uniref:tRNA pseudouridine(38-40) synthase TruA n=1 Tax=Clostridium sp. OM02-18AC TaxID=2292311 RepID=UPI000E4DB851|nr:tRNA pseudouridine(38-40) synthase TruA [Clostridium sp. OM02-18AC]RHV67113.1 tRNA pseudouridine(38-40) synthase TruA [Clostridium sp. OM02-18AC]
MKRVKLVVAYDGTAYRGWQLQPNGITIEEVLNRELTALLKEPISVIGASRTDSGVHARGNVAVFDTENRMPADKICFALNQRLPEDIRVQSSKEVPADWHPRKANCTKTYEYKVLNRKISMPLERLYAHFCYFNLDLEKMRQAAAYLIGEHDFKSFCTVRTQAEETVRTIYSLDITKQDDMITIRIRGSGFLYNMVRIIAGTLLEVGMGAYPPEHMEEILDARDRQAAGRTAPARGLTLVSMEYQKELPDWHHRENKYWKYDILQSHIKDEKTAFFVLTRCVEEELDGILRRNIHHAFQNGAEKVYVTDLEKPERLQAGDVHGRYVLKETEKETGDCFTPEEAEALRKLVQSGGERPDCAKCAKPSGNRAQEEETSAKETALRWVTALPLVDNTPQN